MSKSGLLAVLAVFLCGATETKAATVAAGDGHTLVIKTPDGTVWSWGVNGDGQLGNGTTISQTTPVPVGALTGIVAVAAGGSHSLALKADGTVWSWGANGSGQLGNGSATSQSAPGRVSGLTGVTAIAAGGNHSVALRGDGTAWAWGDNGSGQLGDGGTTSRSTPGQVTGIAAIGIAAGGDHTLAVLANGSIRAWGANGSGELGDGTTTPATNAVAVSVVSSMTSASGGRSFSLARKSNGTAWSWGDNGNGRLGDETTTRRLTAVQVSGLSGVSLLAGGSGHSLALLTDGSVRGWGQNSYGQVGDGTATERLVAVTLNGLAGITSIAAGQNHSVAVAFDGVVWCWGHNGNGQIGDGTTTDRPSPVKVSESGFKWKVGTPTFSPGGGVYGADRRVTISSATSSATIRYTTDGTDPTTSSRSYISPVLVTETTTLKAQASRSGLADSNVASADYTMKVVTPTLSPGTGTYRSAQAITISTSTRRATIRYTTDGTDPSSSSTVYAAPIPVSTTTTVKARGFKSGWIDSDVASAAYTLDFGTLTPPTMSPTAGTYPGSVSVTLRASPGATIRYTTNGTDPSAGSTVYTAPIALTTSRTLKAKAFRMDYIPSATSAGTYTITRPTPATSMHSIAPTTDSPAATPTMSPPPGAYASPQMVSLSCATPGATLRYTTDGSDPTFTSPLYQGPISVSVSTTLKARTFKGGDDASAIATGQYIINGAGQVVLPTITPGSGTYSAGILVTISTPTKGATIRYTTDGRDPTTGDPVVAGPLLVSRSMRVKAKAWGTGLTPSGVRTADYTMVGAVAAGQYYTVVLKSNGTVWAWGDNYFGQLGDGTRDNKNAPVQVVGPNLGDLPPSDVVAIAAAFSHTLALKRDGRVWAWGRNGFGQLGNNMANNDSEPQTRPVQVVSCGTPTCAASPPPPPLENVIAIAAGLYHSLALKADGTVWAWGSNQSGQLGNGGNPFAPYYAATQVPNLTGVVGIAAGLNYSLALKTDGEPSGTVMVWGANTEGQLGAGAIESLAVPTVGPSNAVSAVAGSKHSLVLLANGTVLGAGRNGEAQLGNGTTNSQNSFLPVFSVGGIKQLGAGGLHTVAALNDGAVWGAGWNECGEVGDLSFNDQSSWPRTPKKVPVKAMWITDGISVAVGRNGVDGGFTTYCEHSVVLGADGRVWTWGWNYYGQLGQGTGLNDTRFMPRVVPGFSASDHSWPDGDPDGDGLTTEQEIGLGSDPLDPDTNDDGILDGTAFLAGLSLTNPDMDGDGVANAAEVAQGTDPLRADTDGDGVPDGLDCFPLDATRSQCPPSDPNDHTPPVISLAEPTNAVLVSSNPP